MHTEQGGYDFVAQLVEHNTFNVGVEGSNPSGITKMFFDMGVIWHLTTFWCVLLHAEIGHFS